MLNKLFRGRAVGLATGNKNAPACATDPERPVSAERMRALATGAALAVDVDNSPAVLLSIQAYAQSHRETGRRTA